MYAKSGVPRETDIKRLKKCNENWGNLQKQTREVKKEIAPFVTSEADKAMQAIKKFDEELKNYATNLKAQNFQKYDNGVENSIKELAAEEKTFTEHESRLKELELLSSAFGFPEAVF